MSSEPSGFDDGSQNRSPEGLSGDAMQRLQSQVDGISDVVDHVEETVGEMQTEIKRLRNELQTERQARLDLKEELSSRVSEIDERTDMLSMVEDADQADGEQRTAALIQHLRRKAERKRRAGDDPRVRIDRDGAEEALHYPDVERTTIYADMERVVRWLVGPVKDATLSDVAWYTDGKLHLDLSNGTVRLSRPRDGCGDRPQNQPGEGGCGRSTTDSTGEGGRNTGSSAGQDNNHTR